MKQSVLQQVKRHLFLWLFVFLNIADYTLTKILLNRGGIEANPIWGAFPLEIKLLLAIAIVLMLSNKRILAGINIGMLLVVILNTSTLILI